MIIAVANQDGGAGKTVIANHLALLRTRSGRKVMLVDAARAITARKLVTDLELLRVRYNDIVIDTEGRDTAEGRAALIAARLVVVPVTPDRVDLSSQYKLIARLNSARMFNPGLRVLFVLVADHPSDEECAAVRAYTARVMSATLASTVIHEQGQVAADMDALYREVFSTNH
jgi:chromosome partitioning protein